MIVIDATSRGMEGNVWYKMVGVQKSHQMTQEMDEK